MNRTKRLTLTTVLALGLSLGLAACSEDEPAVETPADQPAETGPAGTDDGADETTDAQDGATTEDGATTTSPVDDTAADLTAIALMAIATAEAEVGGTAYEIDDQDDDGTWEVEVRVDDRAVEVTVSADGTEVVGTEDDDLDEEDGAALEASTITLTEAIELAVAESGGVLDDAELEGADDGQPHHWEVTVDTDERDDVEVLISVTGEVLGTDD